MKLINIISAQVNIDELSLICDTHDTLLLRQDAVYLCLSNNINWPCQVSCLKTDLEIRNLNAPNHITVIDESQWVELTINAKQSMLWQR